MRLLRFCLVFYFSGKLSEETVSSDQWVHLFAAYHVCTPVGRRTQSYLPVLAIRNNARTDNRRDEGQYHVSINPGTQVVCLIAIVTVNSVYD